MTAVFVSIGILIILGLILGFLKDRTEKTIQYVIWGVFHSTKVGIFTYFIIFLPGIILHELSHLFAALFLGVPTGDVRIFPVEREDKKYQLGEVKTAESSPIKESIIGLAPIIVGGISIMLIVSLGLRVDYVNNIDKTYLTQLIIHFMQIDKLRIFLCGYGIFCFSNTMFISESDRKAWVVFPLLMLLFISLIYFIRIFPNDIYINTIVLGINYLSAAFVFSIIIDTLFFIPMGIVNYFFLRKRR